MANLQTEILVIGGGATGTGVLRDLALRGFKAILVEKGDLTHGTTGRYHGLLHSGGRYVVKDPQAAANVSKKTASCAGSCRTASKTQAVSLLSPPGMIQATPHALWKAAIRPVSLWKS